MTNIKYEDSGVEWIGEIPKHWKVVRVGSIYKNKREKVSALIHPPLSVTKKGVVPQLKDVAKSDAVNNRRGVSVGDFVINSRSDRKMSCGLSQYKGSVSLINLVLECRNSLITPSYTSYLLRNYMFAEEFYRWGNGIVDDLWSTNYSNMKNILLPLPPKEEQEKIAKCLDRKVGAIDNIIDTNKKLVEKHKEEKEALISETITKGLDRNIEYKDSGIEWIGEIPKHWKVGKIGYNYYRKRLVNSYPNPQVLSLTRRGVVPRDISNNEGQLAKDYSKYHMVKPGDFLINPMDLVSGANCNISHTSGVISPAYINIQNKNRLKYETIFLSYYVKMLYIQHILYAHGQGVSFEHRWTINNNAFFNLPMPLPPKEEQEKIADYLDREVKRIDTTIEIKEKQIKLFEEYRDSLIYEYVTGKKLV